MPDILPTIDNEPAQGIQALLDTVYLWNQDVANDLIEKVNELLEELEVLTNSGTIKPYAELTAPIQQYMPMSYNNAVYVANEAMEVLPETPDLTKWTQIATKVDQGAIETQIQAEEDARIAEDAILQGHIDSEASTRAQADTALGNRITAEETARSGADSNLQTQIDAISASSDVKDIVGTHAELEDYDTSTLGDNDIIKVLQDETEEGATTYYRWVAADQEFSLIGEEGPYYTKAQADTLLNQKQNTLTAGEGITIENGVISATASGDFVPQYDTMPTADASNAGDLVQYSGESVEDSYQKGYFYASQPTYTDPSATISQTAGQADSISFERTAGNTEISGATEAVRAWFAINGWGPTTPDTLTFECMDASEQSWRCQCGSQPGFNSLSAQSWYEQLGFVFTGTPQTGDIVVCTYVLGNIYNLSVNVDTFIETEHPSGSGNTAFTYAVSAATLSPTTFDVEGETLTINPTTFMAMFAAIYPSIVSEADTVVVTAKPLPLRIQAYKNGASLLDGNIDNPTDWGISFTGDYDSTSWTECSMNYSAEHAGWQKSGADVNLTDYGVSYSGTPVNGDTLTVSYTAPAITGYTWNQTNVQPAAEPTGIKWETKVDLPAEYTGNEWGAAAYFTIAGGLPDGEYEFYYLVKSIISSTYPVGERAYKVRIVVTNQNNSIYGQVGYVFDGDYMNTGNRANCLNTQTVYNCMKKNGSDVIFYPNDWLTTDILAYNNHQAVAECFKLSAIKNVETGQEYVTVGAINLDGSAPQYTSEFYGEIQLAPLGQQPYIPSKTALYVTPISGFEHNTIRTSSNAEYYTLTMEHPVSGSVFVVEYTGAYRNGTLVPYAQKILKSTGVFAGCYLATGDNYVYVMGVDTTTAATMPGDVTVSLGVLSNDGPSTWFEAIPQNATPVAQAGSQGSQLGTITYDGLGNIVQYTGETNANYTNGYFYKATGTVITIPTSITFINVNPSDVTVTVANPDALVTALNSVGGWGEQWVRDRLTLDYTEFRIDYNFDTGTIVRVWWSNYGDFYNQDVLNCFAVSTTGSYTGENAITFACNRGYAPESKGVQNTAWVRVDVQPGGGGGDVDYNRVVEKTASALPTPTAALNGKAYMYVGQRDWDDNTKRDGAIYQCTQGVVPSSVSSSYVSQTITNVTIGDAEHFVAEMGWAASTTVTLTAVEATVEKPSQSDGYEPNTGIHWYITNDSGFVEEMHNLFPAIDFYDPARPPLDIGIQFFSWDESWSVVVQSEGTDLGTATITSLEQVFINTDEPIPEGTTYFGVWGISLVKETTLNWSDGSGHTYTYDWLAGASLYIDGYASAGDTITIVYTTPTRGYIWKPVDNKYFKLPPLLEYTNEIVQYIGWGNDKGKFYRVVETSHTESQYSITQTAGTELSGLGMGDEAWKFGEQLEWPQEEVDVAFKFIETTQTTGNVTYNLTNIQATIDLNTFYSALSEITTVDMANMYKPEYATEGWQIAVKDPSDNWSIIAQSVDPAHWGITITSGTPVAWQDSIEVYFTALGGDSWEEYVDGTLFKSVPAKEWGIVYSGTPEAGVELLGHFTPASTTYGWEEIKNVGGAAEALTKQLTVEGWQNNEQAVDIDYEVLHNANALIVTPTPESMDAYVSAGVMCVRHDNWSATFSCKTVPSVELSVNIAII